MEFVFQQSFYWFVFFGKIFFSLFTSLNLGHLISWEWLVIFSFYRPLPRCTYHNDHKQTTSLVILEILWPHRQTIRIWYLSKSLKSLFSSITATYQNIKANLSLYITWPLIVQLLWDYSCHSYHMSLVIMFWLISVYKHTFV